MEDKGYKSSVEVWIGKVASNIWELQKRMWDHINSYIHASNGTVHQHKEEAMTAAIWREFSVGQNILPVAYSGLFTGKFQRLLKDDGITKSQWIRSVCNAQDQVMITSGLVGCECNKMIVTFILRHKRRKKRKLE